MNFVEMQSDQLYSAPDYWVAGVSSDELSRSADEVPAGDVYRERGVNRTPAMFCERQQVYYFCREVA